MILWVLSIVPFCVVAWVGYTFVHAWMTEAGSFWQRTLAAARDSATIVLAKVGIFIGMLVPAIDTAASKLGDPSLISQIQPYLTPTTVSVGGAVVCLLFIWARLRTL